MSPSARRPQRQQFVPNRPRSEVITAVGVSAAIVIGTALLVWLMRPGQVGVPGGGGIFNRQPRMTILVLLAAAVVGGIVLYVVRRRNPPRFGTRNSIAIGSFATIVVAVGAGIFWPGGVIHHWPAQIKLPDTPDTVPATTPTTKAGTPTTKAGTPTTKAGTVTTVTPTSATPTSVTATTVKGG